MPTHITFTDCNGKPFTVELYDFCQQLRNNGFLLFGMDLQCLLEMRRQYMLRGGELPPTMQSIQKAFDEGHP